MMDNSIADSIRFQYPPLDIHIRRRVNRQLCGLTSYSRLSTPTPLFARRESAAAEALEARWNRCRWKVEEMPAQTAHHGCTLLKTKSKDPGLRRAAHISLRRTAIMFENVENRAARDGRNAVSLVLYQGACKPPLRHSAIKVLSDHTVTQTSRSSQAATSPCTHAEGPKVLRLNVAIKTPGHRPRATQ
jgi:hypothetical protein